MCRREVQETQTAKILLIKELSGGFAFWDINMSHKAAIVKIMFYTDRRKDRYTVGTDLKTKNQIHPCMIFQI